jgi:uncharacterized peroxidase-related enzyme
MRKINVIQPEEATGRLKEIYNSLQQSRGKIAEVHKIQSLRPESIVKHMDLYMEIMYSRSELSRAEREMMAVVVSATNNCPYCVQHHAEALNNYWKNDERVKQLAKDFNKVDLTEKEKALCAFARQVTLNPDAKHDPFSGISLTDEALLDATLVVAYFNFVNRIVLTLDVELETDEGKGYKY